MKGVCKKRDENGSNGKWKSSIKILGRDKGRVEKLKRILVSELILNKLITDNFHFIISDVYFTNLNI